jgi:hypothetical protein
MTGVNLPSSIPPSTLTTTAASPAGNKFYTPCEVNDDDNDVEMTASTTTNFCCSSNVMNGRNHEERGTMHLPVLVREREDDGDDDEEDDFYAGGGIHPTRVSAVSNLLIGSIQSIVEDIVVSADILFRSKITILLLFAPLALVGDATSWVAPSLCFVFAAGALIPCAERYAPRFCFARNQHNCTFQSLLCRAAVVLLCIYQGVVVHFVRSHLMLFHFGFCLSFWSYAIFLKHVSHSQDYHLLLNKWQSIPMEHSEPY